ncbi:hypothetical protein PIIN_05158 [Serendipita indica DSM 11827]|uniref:STEEP1 domain-containing protein n=1 Tax=Serendipita indica (strain DSM 11827) TaxID=1109443 RepID=G4TIS8_SERID|nr:hypothetical protein PIIN_05158 [Serendipita indica DSM 11827]
MPKVISRSTISSSAEASATTSATAALRTYYCLCGEFILVIDKTLSNLPRRTTDNAIILRSKDTDSAKACVFKLNAKEVGAVLVERPNGLERQFRYNCPRCNLLVAYQNERPPTRNAPFVYIVSGALSLIQGQVPDDAFDGEEEHMQE